MACGILASWLGIKPSPPAVEAHWAEGLKSTGSPLDCREVQPVHPKGDQSGVFIGRTDVEAETPILWPSDVKSWLIGKDPDSGRDWGQEEKGMTEDEMIGWHHWLNGHEFQQTPGDSEGQGSLACCSPWGHKELDMTQQLNKDNKNFWAKERKKRRERKEDLEVMSSHIRMYQKLPEGLCNKCC